MPEGGAYAQNAYIDLIGAEGGGGGYVCTSDMHHSAEALAP